MGAQELHRDGRRLLQGQDSTGRDPVHGFGHAGDYKVTNDGCEHRLLWKHGRGGESTGFNLQLSDLRTFLPLSETAFVPEASILLCPK